MRSISTEVIIKAPAERVWEIFTNFDSWPKWNPFIKSISGDIREGGSFLVVIQPPGGKAMTFKPTCLVFKTNTEFRWLGHLGFRGIFDGEHIFELSTTGDGHTRFVQSENFSGILVPLLWKSLDTNTRKGFMEMNEALKKMAEGASH